MARKQTAIRIEQEKWEKLRTIIFKKNTTLQAIVSGFLDKYISENAELI